MTAACPRCNAPMGDGDRVIAGVCGMCRHFARKLTRR